MCVCVCVCVFERDRQTHTEREAKRAVKTKRQRGFREKVLSDGESVPLNPASSLPPPPHTHTHTPLSRPPQPPPSPSTATERPTDQPQPSFSSLAPPCVAHRSLASPTRSLLTWAAARCQSVHGASKRERKRGRERESGPATVSRLRIPHCAGQTSAALLPSNS